MKSPIHPLLFALLFALVLATLALSARTMLHFAAALPAAHAPSKRLASPTPPVGKPTPVAKSVEPRRTARRG